MKKRWQKVRRQGEKKPRGEGGGAQIRPLQQDIDVPAWIARGTERRGEGGGDSLEGRTNHEASKACGRQSESRPGHRLGRRLGRRPAL